MLPHINTKYYCDGAKLHSPLQTKVTAELLAACVKKVNSREGESTGQYPTMLIVAKATSNR